MTDRGMTLPEALVALALLGLLSGLAVPSAAEGLARQRLTGAVSELGQAIERARAEAERQGRPCSLALAATAGGDAALPACLPGQGPLPAALAGGAITLTHNLPGPLRISRNGLVLDGGTLVLSSAGHGGRRCLVIAPPLGMVRQGSYAGDPSGGLQSAACHPDPTS